VGDGEDLRKVWKGALIGGVIGILLPILIFMFLLLTCQGSTCGDYGFALQSIFFISLLTFLIGLSLGYIVTSKKRLVILFSLLGFIIPWIYFFYKYLYYINLPRIEQRGFGSLLFGTLIFCFVLTLLGAFMGKLLNKNEK